MVHSAYSTLLDAARDPRLVMNNPIFGAARNPSGFGYPAVGAFATIPQLPRGPPRPAPRNGQHSEEVLSERLGLSSADVARLTDRGVVGVSRG